MWNFDGFFNYCKIVKAVQEWVEGVQFPFFFLPLTLINLNQFTDLLHHSWKAASILSSTKHNLQLFLPLYTVYKEEKCLELYPKPRIKLNSFNYQQQKVIFASQRALI